MKINEKLLNNLPTKDCLKWSNFFAKNILTGVSQDSVLRLLLFLIDINDLLNGTESICKVFACDTSLF